jgi:hypothetical protein
MQSYIESLDSILDVRTTKFLKSNWRCLERQQKPDKSQIEKLSIGHLHGLLRWWSQAGSNRRPPACKAGALPAELWPRCKAQKVVGLGRFELPTSPLSGVRSNQLSYRPESSSHTVRANQRAASPDEPGASSGKQVTCEDARVRQMLGLVLG